MVAQSGCGQSLLKFGCPICPNKNVSNIYGNIWHVSQLFKNFTRWWSRCTNRHDCFFFLIRTQRIFLLFNSVGFSLQEGYEAQRHIKAFKQISSAPILTAGHLTNMIVKWISPNLEFLLTQSACQKYSSYLFHIFKNVFLKIHLCFYYTSVFHILYKQHNEVT